MNKRVEAALCRYKGAPNWSMLRFGIDRSMIPIV